MPIGSQERRQSLFLSIEGFSRRHPGAVFLATFVTVCVAGLLGSQIRLNTDVLDLVPKGDRSVEAFKGSLKEFGGADYIAVLIEAPPGRTADEYFDYADLFAEKAAALEGVQQVEHRLGGGSELLDLFRRYALLFLPPEEIPKLKQKLSRQAIRAQVAENRRILESPSSTFLKDIVRNDPMGVGSLVWGHVMKGQGALRFSPRSDGYFMSEDQTALLVLVKPGRPAQDLTFTALLAEALHGAAEEARAELGGPGGLPDVDRLSLDYAGSYIAALDDSNLIKSDMKLTAVISFIGVLGLYLVGYRRMGALFYSSVPLMVGQVLTFAVAFLVFGHINSASSGFVAMVMGLGTDFTIVMYARYVEERRQGLSLGDASRRMMGEGALGMFTGAITSAGTFYSMCVTEFRGLWELGFLIGTGILLSMVAILFLLPAMIQFNEGRRRSDVVGKLRIQSFGLERMIPLSVRHPAATLVLLAGITAIAGVAAWHIEFSDSVRDLRSPYNRGAVAQEKVARKFGGDLNFMIAIVDAPSMDGAVEKVGRVVAAARPYIDAGIMLGTDSILSYLPAPSRQQQIIDALRSDGGAFGADRVEADFREALADQGFRDDAFDEYLRDFRAVLSRAQPVSLSDMREQSLESALRRYVKPAGDPSQGYRAAVYIFLEEGKWRREAPPGVVEALQGDDPGITVTGINVVSKRLREIFARDAKIAISVGLVLVSILLWLDFRSMRLMAVANLQVLTGVVWMMGVMSLAGVEMNFVNCFVATMILGVGVDYGIHLIHRMRFNGGVVDEGVMETGKAVAMAALTNVVGFGSLALSNYPGLRSVGIISSVGSIACLVTALCLLPAIMSLRIFSEAAGGAEARKAS